MSLFDTLTHPVSLFITQQLVIVIFAGFTAYNGTSRLSIGLPIVAGLAWLTTTTCADRIFLTNVSNFLALKMGTQTLHYIDIALIGKWDVTAGGPRRIIWHQKPRSTLSEGNPRPPTSVSNSKTWPKANGRIEAGTLPTFRERLIFGLRALADDRGSNTPWESKGTPRFASSDPTWIPSKGRFLLTRTLQVVAFYLFLDLVTSGPPEKAAELNPPSKIDLFARFHEVTIEELAIRVVSSMITWASIISVISLVYNIMALVCVALGVSRAEDWRPVFNSPLEAYTVRRFWSPFYHQLLRRSLASIATVVTDNFLGLQQGSFASQYLSLFLVFLISGLAHLPGQLAQGLPLSSNQTMTFFIAHFVAICCEDLFGWAAGFGKQRPSWWLRCVGYLWVIAFMGFTLPYWLWPVNSLGFAPGEEQMLPFSVVKALKPV